MLHAIIIWGETIYRYETSVHYFPRLMARSSEWGNELTNDWTPLCFHLPAECLTKEHRAYVRRGRPSKSPSMGLRQFHSHIPQHGRGGGGGLRLNNSENHLLFFELSSLSSNILRQVTRALCVLFDKETQEPSHLRAWKDCSAIFGGTSLSPVVIICRDFPGVYPYRRGRLVAWTQHACCWHRWHCLPLIPAW